MQKSNQIVNGMRPRLSNNTISAQNIQEVKLQAEKLLQSLCEIQFVMSEVEQNGLYSIIRNLEFSTWNDDHFERGQRKLKDLIKDIKDKDQH